MFFLATFGFFLSFLFNTAAQVCATGVCSGTGDGGSDWKKPKGPPPWNMGMALEQGLENLGERLAHNASPPDVERANPQHGEEIEQPEIGEVRNESDRYYYYLPETVPESEKRDPIRVLGPGETARVDAICDHRRETIVKIPSDGFP